MQRLVAAGAPIDGDVAGHSTLWAAADAGTVAGARTIPALVALGARNDDMGDALVAHFIQELAYKERELPSEDPGDWFFVRLLTYQERELPSEEAARAALAALESAGCSLVAFEQYDDYQRTPMDWAASFHNLPVVRALLALGVAATTTSLAYAVVHHSVDIVRVLLDAGAPPREPVCVDGADYDNDDCAYSPLVHAVHQHALESVPLLRDAGVDLDECGDDGGTALMLACDFYYNPDLRMVVALLAAGADVAACDVGGNTALHWLARSYAPKTPSAVHIARLLLDCGADATAVNGEGETPVDCVRAAGGGASKLHALLLRRAAKKRRHDPQA